ncbi:hypothetical protein [Chryseobacterium indoltheticum]|uniref:hypothetical protein n=1 Tax=Chryseobacterium indoltheticum TaxID=254 RepID=UPI003F495A71
MNSWHSNKEIQNYINANLTSDLHSLLLKKSPFPEVSMQEIVQQIKGKQVAQKSFHFFYKPELFSAATQSRAVFFRKNNFI